MEGLHRLSSEWARLVNPAGGGGLALVYVQKICPKDVFTVSGGWYCFQPKQAGKAIFSRFLSQDDVVFSASSQACLGGGLMKAIKPTILARFVL